jgi:CBS domain-containing protein
VERLTNSPQGGAGDLEALARAAELVAEGRVTEASAAIDGALAATNDDDDAALTTRIFASALARRIGHQLPATNLYLRNLDVSQISLFNLLATQLPPVRLAGGLANEMVAGFIASRDEVALFDVGIGTAQQEVALLRELARRDRLPRRLHVIALEPSRSSLAEAERNLTAVGRELDIELVVTPLCGLAEELDAATWDDLRALVRGGVVNAAFALHHVQTTGAGPAAAREAVFRRLRSLEPAAVVLAEPNGDHLQPDFLTRARNCLWHFGTLFRLIDRLPADRQERAAMKLFFAREVDDIIANDESTRAERHEWTDTWLGRLEAAAFTPVADLPFAPLPSDAGFDATPSDGHVALRVDGETLVSIIGAVTLGDSLEAAGWLDTRPADYLEALGPVRTSVSTSASASVRVADVMTTELTTLSLGARLADAARLVASTGASDVMVLDDAGAFVGVLSEGDLIRSLLPGRGEVDVASPVELFELLSINGRVRGSETIDPLVIREPVYLSPDDDLLRAAELMMSRQIRRLPVLDDGRLAGTVSRADLAFALLSG